MPKTRGTHINLPNGMKIEIYDKEISFTDPESRRCLTFHADKSIGMTYQMTTAGEGYCHAVSDAGICYICDFFEPFVKDPTFLKQLTGE